MSYYENLIPAVSSKFSVFGCCLAKEEHINMSNEERLLILSEKYTKWLGKFRKWFAFGVLRNICHSSYKLNISRLKHEIGGYVLFTTAFFVDTIPLV